MSHQKCFGSIRFGFRKAMQYVFRIAILASLCVPAALGRRCGRAALPRNSANPHYTLVRHLFMRQCNNVKTYFRWQSIDAQPESARCVRHHLRPAAAAPLFASAFVCYRRSPSSGSGGGAGDVGSQPFTQRDI